MRFWLVNIFVICSIVLLAQKKEPNVTDYLNKTDQLPFFKYEKEELDTLLAYTKNVPTGVEGTGSLCFRTVSFKVNRQGKIHSIKHLKSKLDFPRGRELVNPDAEGQIHEEVRLETIRLVLLTEGLWYSDSIRENNEVIMNISYKSSSRKVLEDNPEFINASNQSANFFSKKDLFRYGTKKLNANKVFLARIYFEQTLDYFPTNIDAHYNLGTCYYKLKRKDDACGQWKKCYELGDSTVTNELNKYCK